MNFKIYPPKNGKYWYSVPITGSDLGPGISSKLLALNTGAVEMLDLSLNKFLATSVVAL